MRGKRKTRALGCAPTRMTPEEFRRELLRQILAGRELVDPVLKKFPGPPEAAAALYARQIMDSDHAIAVDLSTMRFIG